MRDSKIVTPALTLCEQTPKVSKPLQVASPSRLHFSYAANGKEQGVDEHRRVIVGDRVNAP